MSSKRRETPPTPCWRLHLVRSNERSWPGKTQSFGCSSNNRSSGDHFGRLGSRERPRPGAQRRLRASRGSRSSFSRHCLPECHRRGTRYLSLLRRTGDLKTQPLGCQCIQQSRPALPSRPPAETRRRIATQPPRPRLRVDLPPRPRPTSPNRKGRNVTGVGAVLSSHAIRDLGWPRRRHRGGHR